MRTVSVSGKIVRSTAARKLIAAVREANAAGYPIEPFFRNRSGILLGFFRTAAVRRHSIRNTQRVGVLRQRSTSTSTATSKQKLKFKFDLE